MKRITRGIIVLSSMIMQTQFYSQTCSPQVEQSGYIIVEAENYCSKTDKIPTNGTQKLVHQWTLETSNNDFSGTGYMTNLPDEQCEKCPEHNSPKNGSGPEMTYEIEVLTEGLFNIWPRGFSRGGESNGVHIQFDDNFVFNGPGTNMSGFRPHRQWIWENDSKPKAAKAQIFLTKGSHIVHVYGRDDGFSLDKIILASDLNFVPKGIEGSKNTITPVTSTTPVNTNKKVSVKGEAKLWHKVTLEIEGPSTKETNSDNPFLNYKLTGIFTNGTQRFEVPGYFAADGNAGETSEDEGNIWKIHFSPNITGNWNYEIRFRKGNNIAINSNINAGTAVSLNGVTGSFNVVSTDKTDGDFRGKGKLSYVGEHYLKFEGSNKYFLKGGVDSPENLLAYEDFDGTYDSPFTDGDDVPGFLHAYGPHVKDWKNGDPTWKGNKGKGLIGALNYLESEHINSIYFLVQNYKGDGDDVWPWIAHDNPRAFDCSKLDQWEVVFQHAQQLGIMLHFVFQELETTKEGVFPNSLNLERSLMYREIIARFGHHNAVVWNMGEESEDIDAKAISKYIKETDPYDHIVVLHTTPRASTKEKAYDPLLGFSYFDGISFQHGFHSFFDSDHDPKRDPNRGDEVKIWREKSAKAGRKWIINNDEQESFRTGVVSDKEDPDHFQHRAEYLWGTYMGGGAGVEWYFGSENFVRGSNTDKATSNRDRTLEDFRTRQNIYRQTWYARSFFETFLPFQAMENRDDLVNNKNWCFADPGNVYTVYLPKGGRVSLDLEKNNKTYVIKWLNPRNGGGLVDGTIKQISGDGKKDLGLPPLDRNKDWAILIQEEGLSLNVNNVLNTNETSIQYAVNNKILTLDIPYTDGTMRLFDLNGKEVMKKDKLSKIEAINLNTVSSGLYILTVENKKGNKFVSKIIL